MKKIIFLFLIYSSSVFSQFPYNISVPDVSGTGYYFLSPFKNTNNTQYKSSLNILNGKGEMVFYFISQTGNPSNFRVQKNGKMSYSKGIKNYVLNSNFELIDSVSCLNGYRTDSHEFIILENGHYILLGEETRVMDLSGYNYFNGNPGATNAVVTGGVIQELDENKNLVFEWKCFDHFQFSDVNEEWMDSPQTVDWTHCNAIEVDTDGNFLLSSRYFSEITKINKATGNIMWRFGGKRNEFNFTNDTLKLWGQHDCRRIANGNITAMDNGRQSNPLTHPARAVEYQVDEVNKTATLVWSYVQSPNSVSRFMGNVQRLSNGNTVISFGGLINAINPIVKVSPAGDKLFEISFPDTATSYRCINSETLPFALNRPTVQCYNESGNYYLEAPAGFNSYKWSTGETTQRIQITQTGKYQAFVNYGIGYMGSEVKTVLSMSNPCESIGIVSASEITGSYKLYQNYPNPFNPVTKIKFEIPASGFVSLKIYDVTGKQIENLVNENLNYGSYEVTFNAADKPSGVYYCKIVTDNFQEIRKMVLVK